MGERSHTCHRWDRCQEGEVGWGVGTESQANNLAKSSGEDVPEEEKVEL